MDSDLANSSNAQAQLAGLPVEVIDADAPERETRVYSTLRLRSFHGYRMEPLVEDILDFRLPPLRFYHSRVVVIRGRPHLLWSPNSFQDPYYPGIFLYNGRTPLPIELNQRRYDGQRGISDFTQVPQVYQADRPWLGFVYRPSQAPVQNVEYAPAHSVWDNPVGLEEQGRLRRSYVQELRSRSRSLSKEVATRVDKIKPLRPILLDCRPRGPTSDEFDQLEEERRFEIAVDLLADLQREIREKDAWLTLADSVLQNARLPRPTMKDEIAPADERYMGTWINGIDKDDCLWFLCKAALPCFVIHALPEKEAPPADACRNVSERTDVEPLLEPLASEYDRLAMSVNYRYTTSEQNAMQPLAPRRREFAPAWSDLRLQLGRAAGESIPPSVPYQPLPVPELRETGPVSIAMATGSLPENVQEYAQSALVEVDPTRLPWMRPPAIQPAGTIKLSIFREDVKPDGSPYMRELGRGNSARSAEGDEVVLHDRVLRRRLIYNTMPPLGEGSGFTTGPEYGRPVTNWPFAFFDEKKYWKREASTWAYPRDGPSHLYRGRVAQPPPANQLPRRDDGSFDANDGDWARPGNPDDHMYGGMLIAPPEEVESSSSRQQAPPNSTPAARQRDSPPSTPTTVTPAYSRVQGVLPLGDRSRSKVAPPLRPPRPVFQSDAGWPAARFPAGPAVASSGKQELRYIPPAPLAPGMKLAPGPLDRRENPLLSPTKARTPSPMEDVAEDPLFEGEDPPRDQDGR
ncbi:hypothetical protein C8R46DRAFT_1212281 [Mycena filopes]|nr:hypothetical protein C8R46DRAFT_1212281 [Mycena filopes]